MHNFLLRRGECEPPGSLALALRFADKRLVGTIYLASTQFSGFKVPLHFSSGEDLAEMIVRFWRAHPAWDSTGGDSSSAGQGELCRRGSNSQFRFREDGIQQRA